MPDRILRLSKEALTSGAWLDGWKKAPNPDDVNPTYLGYSVGRWDGDSTLVVDTNGLMDSTWLDQAGHPHSADMRVEERYTRVSYNLLEATVAVDDPKFYTKPWTVVTGITWTPNTTGPFTMRGGEILEYICQENNKDQIHIHGVLGK
jgi:hypothetical protein